MRLPAGSYNVDVTLVAVDGRTLTHSQVIVVTEDKIASPAYGELTAEGFAPLVFTFGDAIASPPTGSLVSEGLVPTSVGGGGEAIANPATATGILLGLVPTALISDNPDYLIITNATGNVASGTTTLTLSTGLDLQVQASISVTRGGIACANVTVLNATTVTYTEPTDGLELGVNHPIIIEAVA
jgi:hypothetical protein